MYSLTIHAQTWVKTDAAIAATGSDALLVVGNIGDTIFVSGNDFINKNNLSISLDEGLTWSSSQAFLNDDNGQVNQLVGVNNKVYASVKLPFNDYLYYSSNDLGNSWSLDTIGLPHYYNISTAEKDAFQLKRLSGGYIVAYNSLAITGAYYKHENDVEWQLLSCYPGKVHFDFTFIGNTWFSLHGYTSNDTEKIAMSTDFGQTWTPVSMSGLPNGFTPIFLESNHVNKLYITGSTAGVEANAIYYSEDGGLTWTQSNAHTLTSYPNATITDIYAVGNNVFAGYSPNSGDSITRFILSDSPTPNFQLGNTNNLIVDNSGLFPYVAPVLNFFNTSNKLFIRYLDDLYSSEISISGVNNIPEYRINNRVYPNPFKNSLHIDIETATFIKLYTPSGKKINSFHLTSKKNIIQLDYLVPGIYILQFEDGSTKRILKN